MYWVINCIHCALNEIFEWNRVLGDAWLFLKKHPSVIWFGVTVWSVSLLFSFLTELVLFNCAFEWKCPSSFLKRFSVSFFFHSIYIYVHVAFHRIICSLLSSRMQISYNSRYMREIFLLVNKCIHIKQVANKIPYVL